MINLSVLTVSGKSQDFLVNTDKCIGDIKNQIQKNHRHVTIPMDQEIKLLYKGIELDETKTLQFYNIQENTNVQIIHKTRPIQISRSYSNQSDFLSQSVGKKNSESLPIGNIFEHYAPSPMEIDNKYSKSCSPNFSFLNDQSKDILKILETINQRLDRLETRVNTIYESVVIPKNN